MYVYFIMYISSWAEKIQQLWWKGLRGSGRSGHRGELPPYDLCCATGVPFPSQSGCGVVGTKEVRTMKVLGRWVTHPAIKDTTPLVRPGSHSSEFAGSKALAVCLDFPCSPHALTPGR